MALGALAFLPVLGLLRRPAGGGATGTGLYLAGVAGLLALVTQAVIDIWVAAVSPSRAAMDTHCRQIQHIAGVDALVYSVVPVFFYVGLAGLVALAAGRRQLGWRAPVLVLAGVILAAATLNLLPAAALCFLLALLAIRSPAPGQAAAASRVA